MVSVSLIDRLRQVARRWRTSRAQTLVVGLCGTGVLVVVGCLVVQRLAHRGGDQPSLVELVDRVGREQNASASLRRLSPATRAPRSRSWTSPLAHQCERGDAAVQQRLDALKERVSTWRRSVSIDPTNFGERVLLDANKAPLDASPRVVILHETVYGLSSAINTFQTPHPRDADQVSYHTLIGLDGQVVDLVSPLKRAYGAGFSAFLGEWAVTNRDLAGSVNNFALHVSLETPIDGEDMDSRHSGYTARQYDSLALVLSDWLETFDLSAAAITTHRHVDLGGERADPRSFDWSALQQRLAALGDLCIG